MMEKSVKAEWSGTRSFPPYGTGNTHNTWYACSMVDAEGREIPWADRDGNDPHGGLGAVSSGAGAEAVPQGWMRARLPHTSSRDRTFSPWTNFWSRDTSCPSTPTFLPCRSWKRRAIWGLMVGEEGKTRIPILHNYSAGGVRSRPGSAPELRRGVESAAFLPQERQLFGYPGGLVNDWTLRTNLEGLTPPEISCSLRTATAMRRPLGTTPAGMRPPTP